jgi:CBS domain-containing protein
LSFSNKQPQKIVDFQMMTPDPMVVPPIVSVRHVLKLLKDSTHHGFPVVTEMNSTGGEDGVGLLEGLVLRSQMLVLLEQKCVRLSRSLLSNT